jgi:hypothetical protein
MEPDFKTSLLREKFTLTDPGADPGKSTPLIALSNRMVVPLDDSVSGERYTFVVRTQNMHSCTRLAAAIAKEFYERGALILKDPNFDWKSIWNDVIQGYEKDWNQDIWAAIYYKGRVIFEDGAQKRHALLDIIEKCDSKNTDDYPRSVRLAEDIFSQAGKDVIIKHDSNIAMLVALTRDEAKAGVMLRGASNKTTFNFTARQKPPAGEPILIPNILNVAAGFLEGVQLAFAVGFSNKKREQGLIEKHSTEDRANKRGMERLTNLLSIIETMETKYVISYRPDRPNLLRMVREAETHAIKVLQQQKNARKENESENAE